MKMDIHSKSKTSRTPRKNPSPRKINDSYNKTIDNKKRTREIDQDKLTEDLNPSKKVKVTDIRDVGERSRCESNEQVQDSGSKNERPESPDILVDVDSISEQGDSIETEQAVGMIDNEKHIQSESVNKNIPATSHQSDSLNKDVFEKSIHLDILSKNSSEKSIQLDIFSKNSSEISLQIDSMNKDLPKKSLQSNSVNNEISCEPLNLSSDRIQSSVESITASQSTNASQDLFKTPAKSRNEAENTDKSSENLSQITPIRPAIEDSSLQLLSELQSLNKDSSQITTHIYRRLTPRRKAAPDIKDKRSLSTPRKIPVVSGFTVSRYSSYLRSPRTTPRRQCTARSPAATSGKKENKINPEGAEIMFATYVDFTGNTSETEKLRLSGVGDGECNESSVREKSPRKFRTPCKSKTKRKLYVDSPRKFTTIDQNLIAELKNVNESSSDGDDCGVRLLISADQDSCPGAEASSSGSNAAAGTSEEENITIDEDIDHDLDEKSQKINLTAKNVRSIIHQVITNEHVKEMVRNTLLDVDLRSRLKDAIFEPKMTRSKLKEVVEKGEVPPSWNLTPVKLWPRTEKTKENFLEMSFPEDEDDDEYKPSDGELEAGDLTDDESVMSHDFMSPSSCCADTPNSTATTRSLCGTPVNTSLLTPSKSSTPTTAEEMGPPSARPKRRRDLAMVAMERSSALNAADTEEEGGDEETIIALRTRSKIKIEEPLDVIESNYVAPDITADMYDTYCDDADWQEFLSTLHHSDSVGVNETFEDEQNDPEYDFLTEIDEEDEDEDEEVRDDKAVRISKKEMTELMNELFEAYCEANDEALDGGMGDKLMKALTSESTVEVLPNPESPRQISIAKRSVELSAVLIESDAEDHVEGETSECVSVSVKVESEDMEQDTETDKQKNSEEQGQQYPGHIPPLVLDPALAGMLMSQLVKITEASTSSSDTAVASGLPVMTQDELNQLRDHMTKHVQLLATTYVMASSNPLLQNVCNDSNMLLEELKSLASSSRLTYQYSYFHAPNLDIAVEVTKGQYGRADKEKESKLKNMLVKKLMSRQWCDLRSLTYKQMEIFSESKAFVFPQMLPTYNFIVFQAEEKQGRPFFSKGEDNLMAMGLDQFSHLKQKFDFMSLYLLPVKTPRQLATHYKNLLAARADDNNAVKYLKAHKKLPEFPRFLYTNPDELELKRPIDRDVSWMPKWFSVYEEVKNEYDLSASKQIEITSPSSVSVCTPVVSALSSSLNSKLSRVTRDLFDKKGKDSSQWSQKRSTPLSGLQRIAPARPYQSISAAASAATPAVIQYQNSSAVLVNSPFSASISNNVIPVTGNAISVLDANKVLPGNIGVPSGSNVLLPAGDNVRIILDENTIKQLLSQLTPSANNQSNVTLSPKLVLNQTPVTPVAQDQDVPKPDEIPQPMSVKSPGSILGDGTDILSRAFAAAMGVSAEMLSNENSQMNRLFSGMSPYKQTMSPYKKPMTPCRQTISFENSPVKLFSLANNGIASPWKQELNSTLLLPDESCSILSPSKFSRAKNTATPCKISFISMLSDSPRGRLLSPFKSTLIDIPMVSLISPNATNLATCSASLSNSDISSVILDQISVDPPGSVLGNVESMDTLDTGLGYWQPVIQNEANETQTVKREDFMTDIDASVKSATSVSSVDGQSMSERVENDDEDPPSSACIMSLNDSFNLGEMSAAEDENNVTLVNENLNLQNSLNRGPAEIIMIKNEQPGGSTISVFSNTDMEGNAAVSISSDNCVSTASTTACSSAIIHQSNTESITVPIKSESNQPTKPETSQVKSLTPSYLLRRLRFRRQKKLVSASTQTDIDKKSSVQPLFFSNAQLVAATIRAKARRIAAKSNAVSYFQGKPADRLQPEEGLLNMEEGGGMASLSGRVLGMEDGSQTGEGTRNVRQCRQMLQSLESACDRHPTQQESSARGFTGFSFFNRNSLDVLESLQIQQPETRSVSMLSSDPTSVIDESKSLPSESHVKNSTGSRRSEAKKTENGKRMTKQERRREMMLEILDPDLEDPELSTDERDTRFAQGYYEKVSATLKTDMECYEKFLSLIYNFGNTDQSVLQLYAEVKTLFREYQDLLDDFSGFLLPGQSVECECFMSNLDFTFVRTFLRKLEIPDSRIERVKQVYLRARPNQLQKIIRALKRWKAGSVSDERLRELVLPVISDNEHLTEEFLSFFNDQKLPPPKHAADIEEIEMPSSDEECLALAEDEYEEVDLEEAMAELAPCQCRCHVTQRGSSHRVPTTTSFTSAQFISKQKHCNSCKPKASRSAAKRGKLKRKLRRTVLSQSSTLTVAGPEPDSTSNEPDRRKLCAGEKLRNSSAASDARSVSNITESLSKVLRQKSDDLENRMSHTAVTTAAVTACTATVSPSAAAAADLSAGTVNVSSLIILEHPSSLIDINTGRIVESHCNKSADVSIASLCNAESVVSVDNVSQSPAANTIITLMTEDGTIIPAILIGTRTDTITNSNQPDLTYVNMSSISVTQPSLVYSNLFTSQSSSTHKPIKLSSRRSKKPTVKIPPSIQQNILNVQSSISNFPLIQQNMLNTQSSIFNSPSNQQNMFNIQPCIFSPPSIRQSVLNGQPSISNSPISEQLPRSTSITVFTSPIQVKGANVRVRQLEIYSPDVVTTGTSSSTSSVNNSRRSSDTKRESGGTSGGRTERKSSSAGKRKRLSYENDTGKILQKDPPSCESVAGTAPSNAGSSQSKTLCDGNSLFQQFVFGGKGTDQESFGIGDNSIQMNNPVIGLGDGDTSFMFNGLSNMFSHSNIHLDPATLGTTVQQTNSTAASSVLSFSNIANVVSENTNSNSIWSRGLANTQTLLDDVCISGNNVNKTLTSFSSIAETSSLIAGNNSVWGSVITNALKDNTSHTCSGSFSSSSGSGSVTSSIPSFSINASIVSTGSTSVWPDSRDLTYIEAVSDNMSGACGSISAAVMTESRVLHSDSIQNTEVTVTSHTTSAHAEGESSNVNTEAWTREEDRLILETLQERDEMKVDDDEVATIIHSSLKPRSLEQIKARLEVMMKLFAEIVNTDNTDDVASDTEDDDED